MRVVDHEVAALELVERRAEVGSLADESLGATAAPGPVLLLLAPVVVPDVQAGGGGLYGGQLQGGFFACPSHFTKVTGPNFAGDTRGSRFVPSMVKAAG